MRGHCASLAFSDQVGLSSGASSTHRAFSPTTYQLAGSNFKEAGSLERELGAPVPSWRCHTYPLVPEYKEPRPRVVRRATVGHPKLAMCSTKILVAFSAAVGSTLARTVPEYAQIINQKNFNVLPVVPAPSQANATTVRLHLVQLPRLCIF